MRWLAYCNGSTRFIFVSEEEEEEEEVLVHGESYTVCIQQDSQECGRTVPIACQRTPKVRLPFCSQVEEGALGGVLWWTASSPCTLAWKGERGREIQTLTRQHHMQQNPRECCLTGFGNSDSPHLTHPPVMSMLVSTELWQVHLTLCIHTCTHTKGLGESRDFWGHSIISALS